MLGGNFAAKVHMNGADQLVVEAGGSIIMNGGTFLPAGGSVAAFVADLPALTGGESPTEAEANADRTAINAIKAAIVGAGIMAAS